ncbi:MAG: metal-sulfur cluster assembly factor [Lutibacter sp.]|jgi:metal-sulfur cluster biosynthetic enzyme|nr:metal-sulfur cluster assembly factor [Lutibacter sp.]
MDKIRERHFDKQTIIHSLKAVIDPELMVNIVDLGLVYDVQLNNREHTIEIQMTLTTPGCPLGEVIVQNVEQVLKANFTAYQVEVHLVWDPVWTFKNLTKDGKKALGRD